MRLRRHCATGPQTTSFLKQFYTILYQNISHEKLFRQSRPEKSLGKQGISAYCRLNKEPRLPSTNGASESAICLNLKILAQFFPYPRFS